MPGSAVDATQLVGEQVAARRRLFPTAVVAGEWTARQRTIQSVLAQRPLGQGRDARLAADLAKASVDRTVRATHVDVNWRTVAIYEPALLVSKLLIFLQLFRPNGSPSRGAAEVHEPPEYRLEPG